MTIPLRQMPTAQNTLSIERHFDAPPAVVFRLWTSPDLLAQWWGPRDFISHSITMDFRIDGLWSAVVRSPRGEESVMSGTYRDIVTDRRIAFSFRNDADSRDTRIVATFEGVNNTTRLRFHQSPFDSEGEREAYGQSWGECFDRLESYLLREHWDGR